MEAAAILSSEIGIKPACEALEVSRAGFYRIQTEKNSIPLEFKKWPSPPRALSSEERQNVLDILHTDRFVDKAPHEVYATLLKEINMGFFRFQKRVRLIPGITLNLSKSSGALSFGRRGAKITIGPKGIRKTIGLPGTGLYYTEQEKYNKQNRPATGGKTISAWLGYGIVAFIVFSLVYFIILMLQ